jgi:ABC-type sulfate/molybdate transport systems ATPase subunit
VTHDPAEARALGDRLLALAEGELRESSLEELGD